MNIRGNKVILRAIEEKDLELFHAWANDPEIWYMVGGWHFPSSFDSLKTWFLSLKSNELNQRFAIETKDHGVIGSANLVQIDWKNKNAFHGIYLGNKDIRGNNYAKDSIFAIMRYAFEELGLNRLDGSMIEYNEASLSLYINKCGWKVEGTARGWYYRKNRFWDKIIVGVTREDYFELIKKDNYWNV